MGIDRPHHPPQYIDQCETVRSPWNDEAVIHFLKVLTQIRDDIRDEMKWDERNPQWFPRWIPQKPAPKDAGFTRLNTTSQGETNATRDQDTPRGRRDE